MKNAKAWAEGKPPIVVFVATTAAYSAAECFELLRFCRYGKGTQLPELPKDIPNWLLLHRRHRQVQRAVFEQILCAGGADDLYGTVEQEFAECRKFWRQDREVILAEFAAITPAEWKEAWSEGREIVRAFMDVHWKLLEELESNECQLPAIDIRSIVEKPEIQFFLRVVMPCVLEYGEHPAQLLRKARTGCKVALGKLVAIDRRVIHEPGIVRTLHHKGRQAELDRLWIVHEAAQNGPAGRFSIQNIKCMLCAWASWSVKSVGLRLSNREIRRFFDAIAKDRNARRQRDTDLPPGDEALDKSIQRSRGLRKLIPKPDKEAAKAVRNLHRAFKVKSGHDGSTKDKS